MGDFETALGYFEQLPSGWGSFPTCVANASILAAQQARGVLDGVFDGAPANLRSLREWLTGETHRRTLAVALAKAGAAQLTIDVRTHAVAGLARTELACRWR